MHNREPQQTAIGQLLEAHRGLVRGGFFPQAQVLATALLDRVETTPDGQGIVRQISTAEGLVIADQVIQTAEADMRDMVQSIVFGI